jgi:hypothetical protein
MKDQREDSCCELFRFITEGFLELGEKAREGFGERRGFGGLFMVGLFSWILCLYN